MQNNADMLVEMIKVDMQQIQTYRDVILKIAIMCIAASYTVAAFLWGSDGKVQVVDRFNTAITLNVGLLLVLLVTGFAYFKALRNSRRWLDQRENAMKRWIVANGNYTISTLDIYPDVSKKKEPEMSLFLEQCPIYFSVIALFAMSVVEYCAFK